MKKEPKKLFKPDDYNKIPYNYRFLEMREAPNLVEFYNNREIVTPSTQNNRGNIKDFYKTITRIKVW